MEPVDSTERDGVSQPDAPVPPQDLAAPAPPRSGGEKFVRALWWALRLALALFLFIGALQIMKTGAASLDILKPGGYLVRNPGSTLGLGWLGALCVLSGSPIAATSLTLVAGGEEAAALGAEHFSEMQGFTMLTGSRLGAAFVVLVTAVIYAMRGGSGERLKPVSTAVMALSTTALIYIPAAFIGFGILRWEPFHNLDLQFPGQFADIIDLIYGPMLDRLEGWNGAILFLGGLGILLISFKVIDSVLPQLDDKTIENRQLSWLTRKWPMFGLGSLVALITMSVAVALTVLVPLVSKRYVKREHIIPYIMGANITTLGDTMLAAFALNSPAAVRIVLAEVIATSILSLILLTFFYPQLRSGIWRFQRQMTKSKPRLAAFTAALFVTPVATIAIAGLAG
jgi:solute carrier family 34 (sodium-dependent phosphate cotransporter)